MLSLYLTLSFSSKWVKCKYSNQRVNLSIILCYKTFFFYSSGLMSQLSSMCVSCICIYHTLASWTFWHFRPSDNPFFKTISTTFECKKMTLRGSSIIIPVCSVIFFDSQCHVCYFPCAMLLYIQCCWSSAIRCFQVPVLLSSLWNGKAVIPPLSISLQLFDGIECEFPMFFIYMMIDGKPCSIHSCC